ncbi:MAG: hypothetical protein WCR42_00550 [bacterium]
MKQILTFCLVSLIAILAVSCGKNGEIKQPEQISEQQAMIKERLAEYAKVEFNEKNIDLSGLSSREKQLLKVLRQAGELADAIFWKQSSSDALQVRDSLAKFDTDEAKEYLSYVKINYGPYDVIYDEARFVGKGPETRPTVGGFYPEDMKNEDFENFVKANPKLKESLESQYTVVVRDGAGFKAIPYSQYYPEISELAAKLDKAAGLTDNPSLKNYLTLRAQALRTNDYYKSDLAWMDLKDNNIDIVIGPIENYEDEMFGYKTAFECVVMVKDPKASKELQDFKANMDYFQSNLPTDGAYKADKMGTGNIIQVVNAVYFGGKCQKGTKTIAAALPNDPKVAEAKGRKLSMYKNHMEAKFNKIVKPIGEELLDEKWVNYVDAKAFTGFVTLHEVSHALGPKYVAGTKIEVRKALKQYYSPIEECKADILSMFNHKLLRDKKYYNNEYIKKTIATYLPGLYRSIRFGTGAHCISNYIQLNYLQTTGAVNVVKGKFVINEAIFFDKIADLAKIILDIEAKGDLKAADGLIAKYGKPTGEIDKNIERLKAIPRDIDTYYNFK